MKFTSRLGVVESQSLISLTKWKTNWKNEIERLIRVFEYVPPNRNETGFIFQIAFIYEYIRLCFGLNPICLLILDNNVPMRMSVARWFWSTCQQPLSSSEMEMLGASVCLGYHLLIFKRLARSVTKGVFVVTQASL